MGKCRSLLLNGCLPVILLVAAWFNIVSAQNNQEIIFKYCTVHPDTGCFNPVNGSIDTVGRDVNELGGGYKFCLKVEKIEAGFAPIRVMLVLDKSYSMCRNPRLGACCTVGDSSDSCMMNDPSDKRVDAAFSFVDSLAAKSPLSEVGVITYDQSAISNPPIPLSSASNVKIIKDWIFAASCKSMGYDSLPTTVRPPPRDTTPVVPTGLGKQLGVKATYLGIGLDSALRAVDVSFSSLPTTMERHIILLTDGAWDDAAKNGPSKLIEAYKAKFAGRTVPTIHGVFLSNSDLHLRHGFPAEGCSNEDMVVLDSLRSATLLGDTKGKFFGGSTPQTVVANFDSLLKSVSRFEAQKLDSVVVTNKTNNAVRKQKTIQSSENTVLQEVQYQITIDDLPLEFGLNTINIRRYVTKPGTTEPEIKESIVSIFRTKNWTTAINNSEYTLYCNKDKTTIDITVTPPSVLVNEQFQVASTITIKDNFILDTVQARVFTQFPDIKDINTIALFHLEGDLKNAAGTDNGTGNALQFTASDQLFGKNALVGGFFTSTIGLLTDDFAIEAWVKPSATTTQTDILSTNAMTLTLTSDRYLTVVADGKEVAKSKFPIDTQVWSHVAVVRFSNQLLIFINGIDASDLVPFSTALSGSLKIAPPVNGVIDEVRISKTHRLRADADKLLRLEVSTVPNISWAIGSAQPTVQSALIIPPAQWSSGSLKFKYSTPVAGRMLVNFQHRGTTGETQWSKNSNVVLAEIDTIGPFVKNSVFTRGTIGADFDTLDIELSEPVLCDSFKMNLSPSSSFEIYEVVNSVKKLKPTIFDGAVYTDFACPANNLLTTVRVKVKPMQNGIVPKRDSIKAIGIYVVDTAGNTPDPLKYGPIQFGPGAGLYFKGIPNHPDDPPMTINPNVRARLGIPDAKANSKLIILQTPEVLVQTGVVDGIPDFADYSVIYDPVGNVVCTHAPIRQSDLDPRIYYIVWDGMNKNSRRVSSGGYLIRAKVRSISDPSRPIIKQEKFQLEWGYKK